jgi:hypothetical protein
LKDGEKPAGKCPFGYGNDGEKNPHEKREINHHKIIVNYII